MVVVGRQDDDQKEQSGGGLFAIGDLILIHMLIDHVSSGLNEVGADDLAINGGVEVTVAAGGFARDVRRVTRLEYRLVAGQEAVGLLELAVEDAALEREG